EAGVELGRPAQELAQPVAPASSLGLARVFGLALELDAVAFGQELDRLGEADALGLLDEIEQVAARLAAEAVVKLVRRVDRERGCALVVEGAGPGPAGTLPPQIGARADHFDDVGRLAHPFDAGCRDPRHRPTAASARAASARRTC